MLVFRPGADHHRLQMLKPPAWPGDGDVASAAREPAEILQLQRECRSTVKISLKGKHLTPLPDLIQEPLHRSLLPAQIHQHPGAMENAAGEPQWHTKTR